MSMERCDKCSRQVDTDFDLECYVWVYQEETGEELGLCLCEPCREESEDGE